MAPNVTKQSAVFGEASYKLTPATNAGQAKSYGPELELAIRLTPQLTVIVSGTYTKAFLLNARVGVRQGSVVGLSGRHRSGLLRAGGRRQELGVFLDVILKGGEPEVLPGPWAH